MANEERDDETRTRVDAESVSPGGIDEVSTQASDPRLRELARVYAALSAELVAWQTKNNSVRPIGTDAPFVYKLHMLVRDHEKAPTSAARAAVRASMKTLLAPLSGIPAGFEFTEPEVKGLEKLMLVDDLWVLAPYDQPLGTMLAFW